MSKFNFKEFKPTSWSIDNKTSIYILALFISLAGIISYNKLPKEKFPDIYPFLKQHLLSKKVVIYNASFDTRILDQCCDAYGLPRIRVDADCAMAYYSQYVGEWSDYHCSYRWQKLPGGDHSARGDCLAVLKIMQEMAEDFLSK